LFQVEPSTGETEDDGVEDEYQLEDLEIVSADYMLKVGVSNFRNAWENMDPETERVDEYGLGVRESLAEAVSAVISILGMQPCEVSLFYHSFYCQTNATVIYNKLICNNFFLKSYIVVSTSCGDQR
jgi:hypothetical protein